MKKIFISIFVFALSLTTLKSQTNGSLTLETSSLHAKDVISTMDLYLKDSKMLIKPMMGGNMQAGMGGIKMIFDFTSSDYLMLMENNGNKMGVKQNLKTILESANSQAYKSVDKITPTKETKIIEGYKCTKYIITSNENISDVWITKDVKLSYKEFFKAMSAMAQGKNSANSKFDNLEGFPILIESTDKTKGKNATTRMVFKNIKEGVVTDEMFSTEGYTFFGK